MAMCKAITSVKVIPVIAMMQTTLCIQLCCQKMPELSTLIAMNERIVNCSARRS
jgi:hypothetical protein